MFFFAVLSAGGAGKAAEEVGETPHAEDGGGEGKEDRGRVGPQVVPEEKERIAIEAVYGMGSLGVFAGVRDAVVVKIALLGKAARKGDWRKALIAALVQNKTTMKLDWITEQLNMGTRAGVCRRASEARKRLATDHALRRDFEAISRNATLNG